MEKGKNHQTRLNEIVNELAKKKFVEKVIYDIKRGYTEKSLQKDLAQDIYLILLNYKNPQLIIDLYNDNRLDYFIIKIICNNLLSNHSNFYYRYIRPQRIQQHIDFYENIDTNDNNELNILYDIEDEN